MRLGVITDEVSQDFAEAMEFAKEFSLDCVELRSAWEKDPFEYNIDDIEKIKKIADKFKIPVTAISSPVFKCEYSDENIEYHTKKFEQIAKFANILGASKIRCFDFFKNENITLKKVKKAYAKILEICEKYDVYVLLEMEPTANSTNCKEIAETVKYIDNPRCKAVYDPGNDIYSRNELPFPDGFEFIKEYIHHIHIKDAAVYNGKVKGTCLGKGEVDYNGIFSALANMGYDGDIMLETHFKPFGELSEETMKTPKGSAISENGYEGSSMCMKELIKLTDKYFKGRRK